MLTECIKSYFFIEVSKDFVKLIADALLIKISIPPNFYIVFCIQSFTFYSFLISHSKGRTFAPKLYNYLAAVNIVPGSLGWGIIVLAIMTIFAPLAHFFAIAKPIPLDAPVMTIVWF